MREREGGGGWGREKELCTHIHTNTNTHSDVSKFCETQKAYQNNKAEEGKLMCHGMHMHRDTFSPRRAQSCYIYSILVAIRTWITNTIREMCKKMKGLPWAEALRSFCILS